MIATPQLIASIKLGEGCSLAAYPDPKSGGDPWTCGWGHAGVAPGTTWTQPKADAVLEVDAQRAINSVLLDLPWSKGLSQPRFDVLAEMAFNLGPTGMLGFHHMLAALQANDFAGAAFDMLWNSPGSPTEWYADVKGRAERLSRQMATGIYQV